MQRPFLQERDLPLSYEPTFLKFLFLMFILLSKTRVNVKLYQNPEKLSNVFHWLNIKGITTK